MRTYAVLTCALLTLGCGETISATPPAADVTADTASDAARDVALDSAGDAARDATADVTSDGPLDAPTDAPIDAAADVRDCGTSAFVPCPAPPPGCSYVGGPDPCGGSRCGALVCPDAGASDAPAGDAAISCGTSASRFPTFDSACMTDTDCVAVIHQTDCCGNMRGLGIRATERMAFDAAEAVCRPMYPGCGCPSMGILCDDAQRTFSASGVGVACRSGRCVTFVRMM